MITALAMWLAIAATSHQNYVQMEPCCVQAILAFLFLTREGRLNFVYRRCDVLCVGAMNSPFGTTALDVARRLLYTYPKDSKMLAMEEVVCGCTVLQTVDQMVNGSYGMRSKRVDEGCSEQEKALAQRGLLP